MILVLEPIAQGNHGRHQADRGPLVGVTTGIGFRREILGHRNLASHLSLVRRDLPGHYQLRQNLLRRGAEPACRHLNSRSLGDDAVGHHHLTVGIPVDAINPITNHCGGKGHVGRCLYQVNIARQQQIDHSIFVTLFVGCVYQVDAEGLAFELIDQLVYTGFDVLQQQAGGAKGGQKPGLTGSLDQLHRGDAIGHRTTHVRETNTMIPAKADVAQISRQQ